MQPETASTQEQVDAMFVEVVARLVDVWHSAQSIVALYDDAWTL